jgi:hypothetical protein
MKTTLYRPTRIYAYLLVLYLLLWISLTAADLLTTVHGVKLGYRESNPYTDFSSLKTLILPEIFVGFFGLIIFSAGFFLCQDRLGNTSSSFDEFSKLMFPIRLNASALLVLILAAVMVRGVVVINNIVLITSGFAPMESAQVVLAFLGMPLSLTGVFVNSVLVFLMLNPAVYVIYRVIRIAGRRPAQGGRYF